MDDFEAWRCKFSTLANQMMCPDGGCSVVDGCARGNAPKIGTNVRYYPVRGRDHFKVCVVESEPWKLGPGLVVRVSGVSGGVSVNHLRPIPPLGMPPPVAGQSFKHLKTGGRYTIVALAKVEATMDDVVVYADEAGERTWTRPLTEFCDGRFERI